MGRFEFNGTASGKQLQHLVEFATQLPSKLISLADDRSVEALLDQIRQSITKVSKCAPSEYDHTSARDAEKAGRDVWNACIRLRRTAKADPEPSRLLAQAKLLAYHLVELGKEARSRGSDEQSSDLYLLNLALTVGKLCLEVSDIESATTTLQKAAERLERIKSTGARSYRGGGDEQISKWEVEYYALRITLLWKEDRLDVAEYMYNKTDALRPNMDVASAMNLADVLRRIGGDALSKGNFDMATTWLRRSQETITPCSQIELSAEGQEAWLAICQELIQTLLSTPSGDASSEVEALIASVERRIGDKPMFVPWKLESLHKSRQGPVDTTSYAEMTGKMIQSFDFSGHSFDLLINHINAIGEQDWRVACSLLDDLLSCQLLGSGNTAWMHEAITRRMKMVMMNTDASDGNAPLGLVEYSDSLVQALGEPLSPEVTDGIHSLIWKKIEAGLLGKWFDATEKWCCLALHQLFANCRAANKGKFGRKRIISALGLNDGDLARSTYQLMPEESQGEVLTQFLMFKVSLLDWDHELGCESIKNLGRQADNERGQEMLYACLKEAQQVGDKLCTLAALKTVAEKWNGSHQHSTVNLPSVLRCSVRLIYAIEAQVPEEPRERGETGEEPKRTERFAEEVCSIFEKAAESAQRKPKDDRGEEIFTAAELHWFRKNSYNMAVSKCPEWELPYLIRLFRACLEITKCFSAGVSADVAEDLVLMSMRCHFIVAAALVSLARAEDRLDEKMQRYLETRRHVAAFDGLLQRDAQIQNPEILGDLQRKLSALLVFDFEAAVALKSWDDLEGVVKQVQVCRDGEVLKAMGDCLLRSQAPGRVMYSAMRQIINGIYALENFDSAKLAKYIRCLFQVMLPLDESLAIKLVDEALKITRECSEVGEMFPEDELDWLVAVTFNQAIDFFARAEETECHRWALKAMDLAAFMNDEGAMRNLLQDKFARLRLDNRRA